MVLLALLLLLVNGAMAHDSDQYFTVVDELGEIVFLTGLSLDVGDRWIGRDNRMFEVHSVDGDQGVARYIETVTLPDVSWIHGTGQASATEAGLADEDQPVIVYHTHSAESYVPTSGTHSRWWGDIYGVGAAFVEQLEERGFQLLYDETNHNPHDGGAYNRSRRTVVGLLETNPMPAMIIDIHRDATPAHVYQIELEDTPMTAITLVVGRQNQNMQSNLAYAQRIKAVADEIYPGLVRGIFMARGNYNQDVMPRTILLEFGAHTNPKERAVASTPLMAEVMSLATFGKATAAAADPLGVPLTGEERSARRMALGLIGMVLMGGFIFLLLNEGSYYQIRERLEKFWEKDIAAIFKRRLK